MTAFLSGHLSLSPRYTSETAGARKPESVSGQTDEGSGQESGHGSGVLNVLYGGASPLHVASEHGHASVVATLLEYGADPTLRWVWL